MRPRFAIAAAGLATMLLANEATAAGPPAQTTPAPPEGTASQDPATAGSSELEGQGSFGAATQLDEEVGDALEWDLSFGALVSTGNARSTAITGGSNFLIRRGRHQAIATFLGNYGRAAASLSDEPVDTVGNLQGRARYDVFVAKRWSLFGMVTARHDPFQLLDLRLNLDPGVALYVINRTKEQLRFEAGYDFQLDVRNEAAVEREADGSLVYTVQGELVRLPPTRITHAARLAVGYTNKLNDSVGFITELEYLQSLLEGQRWRINWVTSLSTVLVRKLSLSGTFNLRMDNDPLPGIKHLDTLSSLSLVYRFL